MSVSCEIRAVLLPSLEKCCYAIVSSAKRFHEGPSPKIYSQLLLQLFCQDKKFNLNGLFLFLKAIIFGDSFLVQF